MRCEEHVHIVLLRTIVWVAKETPLYRAVKVVCEFLEGEHVVRGLRAESRGARSAER